MAHRGEGCAQMVPRSAPVSDREKAVLFLELELVVHKAGDCGRNRGGAVERVVASGRSVQLEL